MGRPGTISFFLFFSFRKQTIYFQAVFKKNLCQDDDDEDDEYNIGL